MKRSVDRIGAGRAELIGRIARAPPPGGPREERLPVDGLGALGVARMRRSDLPRHLRSDSAEQGAIEPGRERPRLFRVRRMG
jgi:hypothetical protein